MNNVLISREDLKNAKPEFMNEKVVRDTKYRTTKDRIYAKAWNDCNSYWLNTIKNAPTADITEAQAIDKLHETGWLPKHDKEMTEMTHGCTKCPFATECSGAYTKNSKKCSFYKNVPINKEAKYGLLVQALEQEADND